MFRSHCLWSCSELIEAGWSVALLPFVASKKTYRIPVLPKNTLALPKSAANKIVPELSFWYESN